jgi:hypothetical protein
MSVLTGITGAVRSQIAGRLNSAISGGIRSGVSSLTGGGQQENIFTNWKNPNTGKFTTSVMSYPSDVDSDPQQGHYIIFNINKFTPGKLKSQKTKKAFDSIMRNINGNEEFGQMSQEERNAIGRDQLADSNKLTNNLPAAPTAAKGAAGRSLLAEKPKVRLEAAISLYMPPSVQVSYEVKYADQEIGTLAMLGKDAIDAFKGESGDLTAKLTAVKNKLGTGATEGITNLLNASLDTLASGARALQQIESGKVITPRMEMMFEGVGRRSFSYTFNFIPKSADEARTIEKIIRTFKENMMPEYSNPTTRREMNIPNTFDITYMYQNQINGFINKISTCFLQKADVQYGADRYTAYEPTSGMNGSGTPPQKSSITLDFVEIETLSKDMIKEGY